MLPVSGNAIDLVVDPYQGALYVAFSSQGIFKSTDLTGVQWKALGGCLPTSGFGRIALAFGGRRGLGFSQPLPLVYAGFDANGTYRLFVTKDGGDSWSELPSPPSDGQLGFNNVITVGPYNSDEVYIGQIAFWRSFDGGTKGGRNDHHVSPPVESNSWTVLGCCLSDSIHSAKIWICTAICMPSSLPPMAALSRAPRKSRSCLWRATASRRAVSIRMVWSVGNL